MNDKIVFPIAPLWSHFQHFIFPRPYEDWMAYDLELIKICHACLRLDADIPEMNYLITESKGADMEVAEFKKHGKPVFYSKEALYEWLFDEL